jgi:hypothetical protein
MRSPIRVLSMENEKCFNNQVGRGMRCRLVSEGGEGMKMKENRSGIWSSCHISQGRGRVSVLGIFPALAVCMLFCTLSVAHAIGPYFIGNETVIDQGTGLEWQKSDDGSPRNWESGLAYCENLSLKSKTDWRLPNIRELKSIVDDKRYYPTIDPAFSSRSSCYWSATTVADFPTANAWTVHFGNGDDIWYVKTSAYHVRCVRGGLPVAQP